MDTTAILEITSHADELRSLEHALRAHPSVDDCVVLVREAAAAERGLVAYVVPAGPFVSQQLHKYLQDRLPAARLPRAYVPVAALPLMPTGECDTEVLEALEILDADVARRWEEALQAIPGV